MTNMTLRYCRRRNYLTALPFVLSIIRLSTYIIHKPLAISRNNYYRQLRLDLINVTVIMKINVILPIIQTRYNCINYNCITCKAMTILILIK